jgi:hypothetical protein
MYLTLLYRRVNSFFFRFLWKKNIISLIKTAVIYQYIHSAQNCNFFVIRKARFIPNPRLSFMFINNIPKDGLKGFASDKTWSKTTIVAHFSKHRNKLEVP